MHVAHVDRERFIAEVRSSREIPRVRSLQATDPSKSECLLHYEIISELRGDPLRLVHNEPMPALANGMADLAGSLLEQMQHEGRVYELEIQRGVR